MGLARIAIAVLAVVVAFGLLIIGGIALWGALTNKDGDKPGAASPSPSNTATAQPTTRPSHQVGNTIVIHCLASQCHVFVSGPGAQDVVFSGNLTRDERRIFNETRLTVAVQDASTVTVTINGRLQPRGQHGPQTYEAPSTP
jgi:hypothetical protein